MFIERVSVQHETDQQLHREYLLVMFVDMNHHMAARLLERIRMGCLYIS
jgi:hypothetical protein